MKRKTISKRNQLQIIDNVLEGEYPTCTKKCLEYDVSCPKQNSECRMWVDYEDDLNCVHAGIVKNGRMTLREISDRLGVSYVRICQIETATKKKIACQHFHFSFIFSPSLSLNSVISRTLL